MTLTPGGASQAMVPVFIQADRIPADTGVLRPTSIDPDQFTTLGFMAATLTITSAVSIGSNMVAVQNGTMTKKGALMNGLAKGAAASLILSVTPKKTVPDIILTAAALTAAGYAIDKGTEIVCSQTVSSEGRDEPETKNA